MTGRPMHNGWDANYIRLKVQKTGKHHTIKYLNKYIYYFFRINVYLLFII